MNSKFRLTPGTPFPENLQDLGDKDLHVVHSRLRRQMDAEYSTGWFSFETELRLDEVREELDRRESGIAFTNNVNRPLDIAHAS